MMSTGVLETCTKLE